MQHQRGGRADSGTERAVGRNQQQVDRHVGERRPDADDHYVTDEPVNTQRQPVEPQHGVEVIAEGEQGQDRRGAGVTRPEQRDGQFVSGREREREDGEREDGDPGCRPPVQLTDPVSVTAGEQAGRERGEEQRKARHHEQVEPRRRLHHAVVGHVGGASEALEHPDVSAVHHHEEQVHGDQRQREAEHLARGKVE